MKEISVNDASAKRGTGSVRRVSISLPEDVFRELDELVADRGLENRSKAIAEMISHFALKRREAQGDGIMAGMISLVYDASKGNLVQQLFELERRYLKEVISSMHVQLEENHRMEVMIVQGPVDTLKRITNHIIACTGVISCKLTLVQPLIPQVHFAGGRSERAVPV
ncbi:MAG: ribbon-helix-helix protein, CopG family [Verrucomicrobia bacterium]|nr:ribbon-helix-helix protein, CopG family [Verrucomicrobiota bacterium]